MHSTAPHYTSAMLGVLHEDITEELKNEFPGMTPEDIQHALGW